MLVNVTVDLEQDTASFFEGGSANTVIVVARAAHENVAPTDAVAVEVRPGEGAPEDELEATAGGGDEGDDFDASEQQVTFQASDFALEDGFFVARKSIDVTIHDDTVAEEIEYFELSLVNAED